jgi:hypothetical protein
MALEEMNDSVSAIVNSREISFGGSGGTNDMKRNINTVKLLNFSL